MQTFTGFVDWRFFLSWSICPKAVAILGGRLFNNCWLLRPGHVRKLPFLIAFSKFRGVGMKQNPWRYFISSVFVLSLVMIARAQCFTGLEMVMSHNPSVLFMSSFKNNRLRIMISFLSNMSIQSSSHSWPKEIREALCNPLKMCAFLHGLLDLFVGGCSLFL